MRRLIRFATGMLLLAGLIPAPTASATALFALTDTGELFVSGDQGSSWAFRSALPVTDAAGLIATTTVSELLLASEGGTIFRSADAGVTWNPVSTVPASDVVDLAGRPDGASLVLTRSGTVLVSTIQGADWSATGTITADNLASLVVGADAKLYALAETGEVYRSIDQGITWAGVGTVTMPDAVAMRRFGTALVALSGTGLTFRSLDGGATWVAVSTVSQVGMVGLVQTGGELAAVSREGLVARSEDGTSWSWVGSVNQVWVVALASDVPQAVGVPERPAPARGLRLAPPYPNPLPAGAAVRIGWSLAGGDGVAVSLYDVGGRRVAERPMEHFDGAGAHEVRWNPGPLASGIYFLRAVTESGPQSSRRLVILP